jgi:EmrB/QacA subfamily drug resistance transporter
MHRKWWTLFAVSVATFMLLLDITVVNTALPAIEEDLGASFTELQWVIDAYTLSLAALVLTAGVLADRLGRRRVFAAGLAIFTVASLAAGLAPDPTFLNITRAVQGVGGAIMFAVSLALIAQEFPAGRERGTAMGVYGATIGIAVATGPLVGGALTDSLGWESIFFLNVPIGAAGLVVATRVVRESRSDVARRLDVPGLALGTAGLFGLTYGLIEANQRGWSDPLIVGSLLGGAALVVALLLWERRADHPMLPLSFFRVRPFSAGAAVAFSISFGMFGTFFFLSLYMQLIRGYSAFSTGLRFLPLTGMIILVAPNAGRFAQRHGSRIPMTVGLTLAGTGLLLMSRISDATPYWLLAPVFAVMGIGIGATMAPMTAAVMNAVGPQRAGLGSAMTNTGREVGGVFGIALLGTILTTRLTDSLGPALSTLGLHAARARAIGAAAGHGRLDPTLLQGLSPEQDAAVRGAFDDAFLSGFRVALVVAAFVLLAAALIANRFIPGSAAMRDREGDAARAMHAAEL